MENPHEGLQPQEISDRLSAEFNRLASTVGRIEAMIERFLRDASEMAPGLDLDPLKAVRDMAMEARVKSEQFLTTVAIKPPRPR